ncbi:efflux RND transporter periplasmic adaptor subunit [Chroococcidiopsis sp. FACHB-1243]|uniref:efflux RND transporter periplasmic adaptor subunit n=1 Tax=Chroococcidiopsis sp. [FACHB-1243] TaxID=2692781 RepID=UPI001784D3D0|nr:efflux RND transporter periplasmic adaptor subunit [Chroococcidiopsis sp. [FACHB-1243]]MBD2306719.1 efflux RND transporter periplasmic adaptor subunit [Chroococcidiopsis sp. [FACHB-1243]]
MKYNALLTAKVLGVALLASTFTSGCKSSTLPATASKSPAAIPVKLQTLKSSLVQDNSEFVGTLEAVKRVVLQPEIEGRIVKIHVSNGDRVDKGTPIVQLRSDRTQAEYASATAKVNSARAVSITALAQLKAAEANKIKAASEVELQKIQYQRAERLVNEGVQARQQLDIAHRDLNTAIAALHAAEEDVEAAKSSSNQMKTEIKQAQAEANAVNVSLQYKQVLAPIAGVVGDFPVKVGDYVNIGQTLTNITQNDSVDLRLSVPIKHSSQLKLGLPVELIDPNTNKRIATGSISFINPQVNTGDQAILAKARFSNRNGNLRDGEFVKAIAIWNQSPGVLIPTDAVFTIGDQSFVYSVEQQGSKTVVRQKPVQLGNIKGQNYQVLNGVKPGEKIAITEILNLRDNAPVQPIASES